MRTELYIRPEQARYVMALKAKADVAAEIYMAALHTAVAGLLDGGTVETIADDGTVVVQMPHKIDEKEVGSVSSGA